ncbi:hypothetical protein CgunFtcFv8_013371 [Champsocephalus gunnari]|uniref:Uncharacterized protein n=1 Tax=Champsocephalus gunnari TaxID=52237 RepID=A0AAN8HUF5_CHAGU|nr:hypothetical protein CgunFtcFv8_013371 [Champsocephalus gunnari]
MTSYPPILLHLLFFYPSCFAPIPPHLFFLRPSSLLRSFLSSSPVSSADPLSPRISPTLGRLYCGIPSSPDSQPVGSDYLDNPHPFLFYEFALD